MNRKTIKPIAALAGNFPHLPKAGPKPIGAKFQLQPRRPSWVEFEWNRGFSLESELD